MVKFHATALRLVSLFVAHSWKPFTPIADGAGNDCSTQLVGVRSYFGACSGVLDSLPTSGELRSVRAAPVGFV